MKPVIKEDSFNGLCVKNATNSINTDGAYLLTKCESITNDEKST